MITQVKKENLLSFYKNGLDEFHFPEKSQRCMLPAIKRVIQFMDKNSEAFYTPEIGKALIAYEKETDSISDSVSYTHLFCPYHGYRCAVCLLFLPDGQASDSRGKFP